MNDQLAAVSSRKPNVFEKAIVLALMHEISCDLPCYLSLSRGQKGCLHISVGIVVATILFSSDFNHIFPSPI